MASVSPRSVIIMLVVLVAVFRPPEKVAAQAFAERIGTWLGPVAGTPRCLVGGCWIGTRNQAGS